MAQKKFNQNAAIRGAIRRIFSRSPIVREVLMAGRREVPKFNKDGTRSKKDAVQYCCQVCNEWVSSTKVAVDHIEPVISVDDGFIDWNEFVERLGFDKKENLQRICDPCHNIKTQKERDLRSAKKDAVLLKGIKDDLYVRDILVVEYKKVLKRLSKRSGDPYIEIRKEASNLLETFFPSKRGKK